MDEALPSVQSQEVLDPEQDKEISISQALPSNADDLIGLRKRALQLKLEDSLTDTIHVAVDTIKDRIENGDYKYNAKSGEVYRIPISARDVASALAIIYDKRALIRGEATSIKSESKTTLHSLKQGFEQFALQLKEKDVVAQQDANHSSFNA